MRNLALPLTRAGVPIIGTSPDSIDLAEDRRRFGDLLRRLDIPQPENGTAVAANEAREIAARLGRIFLPEDDGRRACHGDDSRYRDDPHWRGLVLFYEYFHGDTGRGVGASHQTGWTALAARLIEDTAARRTQATDEAEPAARRKNAERRVRPASPLASVD